MRADGPFAAPAFLLVLSFCGVVMVPVVLYLYLAHPAWLWMYWIDPADVPSLAVVPVVAATAGALIGGYYLGARLVRADRARAARYAAIGAGVAAGAVAIAARDRLLHYGSFRDYRDGVALDLMDVKLGYVLVVVALGVGAAAVYVGLELFRDSRRVRAR